MAQPTQIDQFEMKVSKKLDPTLRKEVNKAVWKAMDEYIAADKVLRPLVAEREKQIARGVLFQQHNERYHKARNRMRYARKDLIKAAHKAEIIIDRGITNYDEDSLLTKAPLDQTCGGRETFYEYYEKKVYSIYRKRWDPSLLRHIWDDFAARAEVAVAKREREAAQLTLDLG